MIILFNISLYYVTTNDIYIVYIIHKLGGIWIKIGQWISHQENLFSNESMRCLKQLQNNVTPHSYEKTIELIGNDISLFDSIDTNVLGSGTVAQTHVCYLKNNKNKLVLKVLHPDIIKKFDVDKFLFKNILLPLVTLIKPEYKIIYFGNDFEDLMDPINLKKEYENWKILSRNFKEHPNIKTVDILIGKSYYIVESYAEGVHYNNLPNDDLKFNAKKELTKCFYLMLLKHKFIHGDFHFGNFIFDITNPEKINVTIIDYGICYDISRRDIYALTKMHAITNNDKSILKTAIINFIETDDNIFENLIDNIVDEISSHINNNLHLNFQQIMSYLIIVIRKNKIYIRYKLGLLINLLLLCTCNEINSKSIIHETIADMYRDYYYSTELGYDILKFMYEETKCVK